jgi:hypothetical protein
MKPLLVLFLTLSLALPAQAGRLQQDRREYLDANLRAILYHELGHALIDILKLPIYGQEEDAADVLSVFLIDALYEGEVANRMALHTAYGFLGEAHIRDRDGEEPAYWDVHGPDLQRYFTFVCLFYGADPPGRQSLANELELPPARQETCAEEFAQAQESWGEVVRRLQEGGPGRSIRFLADHRVDEYGVYTAQVVGAEVAAMNRRMSLPKRLLVRVEECGTANAFYDSKTREILMCTEFATYLHDLPPGR